MGHGMCFRRFTILLQVPSSNRFHSLVACFTQLHPKDYPGDVKIPEKQRNAKLLSCCEHSMVFAFSFLQQRYFRTSGNTLASKQTGGKRSFSILNHTALFYYYLLNRHEENIKLEMANKLSHRMTTSLEVKVKEPVSTEALLDKMEVLEDYGCTLDQIMEQPDILLWSRECIEERYAKLTSFHNNMSVHLLKKAYGSRQTDIKVRCNEYLNRMDGHLSHISFLLTKLQCNHKELASVFERDPKIIRHGQSHGRYGNLMISDKLKLLTAEGFSLHDIRIMPNVLSKSYEVLENRIKKLRTRGFSDPLPIRWLVQNEKAFKTALPESVKLYNKVDCKFAELANMLGVSDDTVRQHRVFYQLSLTNITAKIQYLLDIGIDKDAILHHSYMLGHNLKKMKEVVEQLRFMGTEVITPPVISGMITKSRILISMPGKSVKKQKYIMEMFENSRFTKEDIYEKFGHLYKQPISMLNEKIEFFKGFGISIDDIVQGCPDILGHEMDVLKNYLSLLPSKPELQPYSEWETQKKKLLNILEYFIEKDVNFSSYVSTAQATKTDEQKTDSMQNPFPKNM